MRAAYVLTRAGVVAACAGLSPAPVGPDPREILGRRFDAGAVSAEGVVLAPWADEHVLTIDGEAWGYYRLGARPSDAPAERLAARAAGLRAIAAASRRRWPEDQLSRVERAASAAEELVRTLRTGAEPGRAEADCRLVLERLAAEDVAAGSPLRSELAVLIDLAARAADAAERVDVQTAAIAAAVVLSRAAAPAASPLAIAGGAA